VEKQRQAARSLAGASEQLAAAGQEIDRLGAAARTAEESAEGGRRTIAELEKSAGRDREAAARDIADLERRLATARADADAAHQRAAQLSAQVTDLASALAALSPSGRSAPTQPAPA
jgi:chromosome segregation ATPase